MRSPTAAPGRGGKTSIPGRGDHGGVGPMKLRQDRRCSDIRGSCGRPHDNDASYPDVEPRKSNRPRDRRPGSMRAEVGGVARGSRRGHREPADLLCHSSRVLKVDILGSDPDIKQCSLDVRVSHQLHQRGQTDASSYHVRSERMSKPMRIGELDTGSLTMVAEQGAQSRRSHARSTRRSFQRNE